MANKTILTGCFDKSLANGKLKLMLNRTAAIHGVGWITEQDCLVQLDENAAVVEQSVWGTDLMQPNQYDVTAYDASGREVHTRKIEISGITFDLSL